MDTSIKVTIDQCHHCGNLYHVKELKNTIFIKGFVDSYSVCDSCVDPVRLMLNPDYDQIRFLIKFAAGIKSCKTIDELVDWRRLNPDVSALCGIAGSGDITYSFEYFLAYWKYKVHADLDQVAYWIPSRNFLEDRLQKVAMKRAECNLQHDKIKKLIYELDEEEEDAKSESESESEPDLNDPRCC